MIRNKPISRGTDNNGSAVNIIPLRTLLAVELTVDHLKHTSTIIQGLDQSAQRPLGKFAIKSRLCETEDYNEFLITNMDASYNVLKVGHGCTRML